MGALSVSETICPVSGIPQLRNLHGIGYLLCDWCLQTVMGARTVVIKTVFVFVTFVRYDLTHVFGYFWTKLLHLTQQNFQVCKNVIWCQSTDQCVFMHKQTYNFVCFSQTTEVTTTLLQKHVILTGCTSAEQNQIRTVLLPPALLKYKTEPSVPLLFSINARNISL